MTRIFNRWFVRRSQYDELLRRNVELARRNLALIIRLRAVEPNSRLLEILK